MYGVGVGIDESWFVWAIVVCLCGADCKVSGVAGYCTSYWDVSWGLIVGANSAESYGLIILTNAILKSLFGDEAILPYRLLRNSLAS